MLILDIFITFAITIAITTITITNNNAAFRTNIIVIEIIICTDIYIGSISVMILLIIKLITFMFFIVSNRLVFLVVMEKVGEQVVDLVE